jgi:hypothetical protein
MVARGLKDLKGAIAIFSLKGEQRRSLPAVKWRSQALAVLISIPASSANGKPPREIRIHRRSAHSPSHYLRNALVEHGPPRYKGEASLRQEAQLDR